jgi:hypothetical protein
MVFAREISSTTRAESDLGTFFLPFLQIDILHLTNLWIERVCFISWTKAFLIHLLSGQILSIR